LVARADKFADLKKELKMKTEAFGKRGFVRGVLGSAVVAGLLAASVLATQNQIVVPVGTTTLPTMGKGERHPEIHRGIELLERAKEILKDKAARDFVGHREKAVEHIELALKQLRECLAVDKK